MIDEMTALEPNHTWILVPSPLKESTVCCYWICTVREGLDGQVDQLKSCLAAKGYTIDI